MIMLPHRAKLFGVGLDAADDPWSLQLKWAWMTRGPQNLDGSQVPLDPYDAVTNHMADILEELDITLAGKFLIPPWLGPRPPQSSFPMVTVDHMRYFFDSNGFFELANRLEGFVRDSILPQMPIMIGIDHSATGGVVSALVERYGAQSVSVVVLDRHFDAFSSSVRLESEEGL